MYEITVRDSENRILIQREIDEPPNEALFDELLAEVSQDCYVDVCRVQSENGTAMEFEDAVEFELVKGDYSDLEALEEDE